jgi:FkbM family methyltransferase
VNETAIAKRLERLLSEPMTSIIEREQTAFDQMTGSRANRIVLWGAGRLGKKTLAGLRQLGIEPLAFCDSNHALWGASIEGIRVLSVSDAAARFGRDATFVITIWGPHDRETMAARELQLRQLGCATVVPFAPLYWKHPEVFGSYYAFTAPHRTAEHAEDIWRAFSLWADDQSRAEFVAQVEWRLQGDFEALSEPVPEEIYFPDDLVALRPEEVFVDCGAYDGDTIRSLLTRGDCRECHVIAFEPDPTIFPRLKQYVSTLPPEVRGRIELNAQALGAARALVPFDATADEASALGKGSTLVECVTLDDALGGRAPTYIKMDIEGSELEAIEGGRRVIADTAPVIAACAYHAYDHPWRIPLTIESLSNEFRFFLRPHHLQAWDLVCYAIPDARLATARRSA